jgi:hypothetical protein
MTDASSRAWAGSVAADPANRDHDDFYPTPPEGTHALLAVETFRGTVWECACGDGRMSRVLEAHGYDVESSDLVDRGYGTPRVDFLMETRQVDNIVTNPPYKLAEEFALHALPLARRKVALLCRLAWLEGERRRRMFESTPLARVWVFSRRLAIHRRGETTGRGMIAFAWYVWQHGHEGPPTIGWLSPQAKSCMVCEYDHALHAAQHANDRRA